MSQTVLLLPGDGIGPEVVEQARRVTEVVAPDLRFETGLVGGVSIDTHGEPLTQVTLAQAKASDAILLGAVGGPKWVGVERHLRPEMGLLDGRVEAYNQNDELVLVMESIGLIEVRDPSAPIED